MTPSLALLKYGAIAGACLAMLAFGWGISAHREGALQRLWWTYVAYVDRCLKILFLPTHGRTLAVLQLLLATSCLALGLLLNVTALFGGVVLALVAPPLLLAQQLRRRSREIEARIEGFLMSLANALRATPSIGSALSYTQPLVSAPLDQELELALKEMRVGSSLEQALLNLAARARSPKLDAALSSLLIGRQIGGNLPQILENTAGTLREMSRLEGVVRSKTAEGKSQLFVLALFPALLVFLFDWIKPNYFAPLTDSVVGGLLGGLALLLWVASVLLARKVLMVN
ncbi:MAG TPA: type II secretion system F family protein, partial [Polyangiales bacterium]|nr:type II secretion system F family protein [Polyangiales bacterium]